MTPEEARDKLVMRKSDTDTVGNAVDQLRVLAGLCNSAEFDITTSHLSLNERKIHGDATDKAVLRLSESLGETAYLRRLWKKEFELAFNSKNKFMIRTYSLLEAEALKYSVSPREEIHYDSDNMWVQTPLSAFYRSRLLTYERSLLTIKGAPDILIGRCSHYTSMSGDTHELDEATLRYVHFGVYLSCLVANSGHIAPFYAHFGVSPLFCTKPWAARQRTQAKTCSCSQPCFINPGFRQLIKQC